MPGRERESARQGLRRRCSKHSELHDPRITTVASSFLSPRPSAQTFIAPSQEVCRGVGFEVSGEGGKGASFRKALQFGWCRSVTGSSRKDAPGRVVVGSNGLDRFPTCTKRIRDGGEIRKVPRPSRPKRLGLPTCAPKKKTKKTRIFGGTERRDRHGFNNEQRRLWAPLVPSHAEGEDRGGGCHRTSSQRKRIVSPVLMARAPRELSPSLAPLLKL